MNPDNIECMWTGEFDLTTRRVDEEMKKLRIQKYPDTHGQGLKHIKLKMQPILIFIKIQPKTLDLSMRLRGLFPGPRAEA